MASLESVNNITERMANDRFLNRSKARRKIGIIVKELIRDIQIEAEIGSPSPKKYPGERR